MARFFQALLRETGISSPVLPEIPPSATLLEQSSRIAEHNLYAGIEERRLADGRERRILLAGRRNFREPWARDLGFASYGLLTLGKFEVLRDTLEIFLDAQLPTGQIPVKIHSTGSFERYLYSLLRREQPITRPLRPKYVTGHGTISLDGNVLLVNAAFNYLHLSRDREFGRRYWPALVRAVRWPAQVAAGPDGLLSQEAFADWADSIARTGRVLYTNVCYWQALRQAALAAGEYGTHEQAVELSQRVAKVEAGIKKRFWREDLGYFVTNEMFDNLSSGGNLLAVAWGLATPGQAASILDRMDEYEMTRPVPTQSAKPPYPLRYVALENRLGRIGFYHTDGAWLWLGAWHVIALCRSGRIERAEQVLERIAKVIVRDQAVHEVYDPSGRVVSGLWYTSEAPLTWSAGMIVYAHQLMKVCLEKRQSVQANMDGLGAGSGNRPS